MPNNFRPKKIGPASPAKGHATGYVVVNHGSFEAMYEALIEPWLGKYDTLREIVGRYERGEISVDEGAAEIELGKHGGDRRSEMARDQADNVSLKTEHGNGRSYTEARLRRDHPTLYEAVQRGELSANAAAIEAGFRKKLTKFEQIVKWIPKLTPSERRQLKELL